MPDLIRHPECVERTGFRLEFIPIKIGAGMAVLIPAAIYKSTRVAEKVRSFYNRILTPLPLDGERQVGCDRYSI